VDVVEEFCWGGVPSWGGITLVLARSTKVDWIQLVERLLRWFQEVGRRRRSKSCGRTSTTSLVNVPLTLVVSL